MSTNPGVAAIAQFLPLFMNQRDRKESREQERERLDRYYQHMDRQFQLQEDRWTYQQERQEAEDARRAADEAAAESGARVLLGRLGEITGTQFTDEQMKAAVPVLSPLVQLEMGEHNRVMREQQADRMLAARGGGGGGGGVSAGAGASLFNAPAATQERLQRQYGRYAPLMYQFETNYEGMSPEDREVAEQLFEHAQQQTPPLDPKELDAQRSQLERSRNALLHQYDYDRMAGGYVHKQTGEPLDQATATRVDDLSRQIEVLSDLISGNEPGYANRAAPPPPPPPPKDESFGAIRARVNAMLDEDDRKREEAFAGPYRFDPIPGTREPPSLPNPMDSLRSVIGALIPAATGHTMSAIGAQGMEVGPQIPNMGLPQPVFDWAIRDHETPDETVEDLMRALDAIGAGVGNR